MTRSFQTIRSSDIIARDKLESGLIMGEELYSGSRILLLDRGVRVTAENLLLLQRARQIDPPAVTRVLVSKPNG